MRILKTLGELYVGMVIAAITFYTFLLGSVVGLFELPRYLKMRSM
jgi:hypothetical protein